MLIFVSMENKTINILFLGYDCEVKLLADDGTGVLGGYKSTKELFTDRLNRTLPGAEVIFANYEDVRFLGGVPRIKGLDLGDYAYVFIGFVNTHTVLVGMLIEQLKSEGVPYMKYGNFKQLDNKLYEHQLLTRIGLPSIPTVVTANADKEILDYVGREFGYPCVVKYPESNRGEGVHLVKDAKSLKTRLGPYPTHVLIQKFIPNDGDHRILVLKGKVAYHAKRVRAAEKEFRNNVSLGGKIIPCELPDHVLTMCEVLSGYIDCDIVGVDIIQDSETGKYYVMEANSAPHYFSFCATLGIDIPGMIAEEIAREVNSRR